MSQIDQQSTNHDEAVSPDACGHGCRGCGGCESKPSDEHGGQQVDLLTRGLLGSFKSFIATGEAGTSGEPSHQPSSAISDSEQPEGGALDDAMDRIEAALGVLASAVPSLEERVLGVETRLAELADIEWVTDDAGCEPDEEVEDGVDRDAVAIGLKDRLARVERECDRLANVPIERLEVRVQSAERALGALVERGEATVQACTRERELAERASDRLQALVEALSPWEELLVLRETENGLPKPLSALLESAGVQLGRELSHVRASLDRFAGVIESPEPGEPPSVRADAGAAPEPSLEGAAPSREGEVVTPQEPDGDDANKRSRRKSSKKRATRAKGSDAEAPRRGASQSRLSAAARLRARSRAEGRPPRR